MNLTIISILRMALAAALPPLAALACAQLHADAPSDLRQWAGGLLAAPV